MGEMGQLTIQAETRFEAILNRTTKDNYARDKAYLDSLEGKLRNDVRTKMKRVESYRSRLDHWARLRSSSSSSPRRSRSRSPSRSPSRQRSTRDR